MFTLFDADVGTTEMYLLQAHYSHILIAGALVVPLLLSRAGDARSLRLFAWAAWAAAALLALNDMGYNLSRDPGRPYANLEMTLSLMSVWPVAVALLIDRMKTWRNVDRRRPGTIAGSVLAACAPQILLLLFLGSAALG